MEIKPPWTDADFLRELREGYKLSQAQLSKLSGVTRAHIANVESGRRELAEEYGLALYGALMVANAEKTGKFSMAIQAKKHGEGTVSEEVVKAALLQIISGVQKVLKKKIKTAEKDIESLRQRVSNYKQWLQDTQRYEKVVASALEK